MWPYTRQENAWLSGAPDTPPAREADPIDPAILDHYRAAAVRMRGEARARIMACAARVVWRLPQTILTWVRRVRRVSTHQSRPI